MRYWLGRVRKGVQRRWDEVVRKWPQPVFTRRGRYEVVNGEIEQEGVGSYSVTAHLWLDPGEGTGSLYSWVGWAEVNGSEAESRAHALLPINQCAGLEVLMITGRTSARILVKHTNSRSDGPTQIVFSGSDAYHRVNEAAK